MPESSIIAISLTAFFVAACIKGVTGLGFSTISLPMLALVLVPTDAIPLVILPSLASNILVMRQPRLLLSALGDHWPLYLTSLPGIAFGVWCLNEVGAAFPRLMLGLIVLAYCAWAAWQHRARLGPRLVRWLQAPVGFSTGLVNGLTGSQVMPLLPYLLACPLDKDRLVHTANLSFTLSSLVLLSLLGNYGLLSWPIVLLALIGIPPVLIGIWLGSKLRRFLPERRFRALVLVILALGGVGLVLRWWWAQGTA